MSDPNSKISKVSIDKKLYSKLELAIQDIKASEYDIIKYLEDLEDSTNKNYVIDYQVISDVYTELKNIIDSILQLNNNYIRMLYYKFLIYL